MPDDQGNIIKFENWEQIVIIRKCQRENENKSNYFISVYQFGCGR